LLFLSDERCLSLFTDAGVVFGILCDALTLEDLGDDPTVSLADMDISSPLRILEVRWVGGHVRIVTTSLVLELHYSGLGDDETRLTWHSLDSQAMI